MTDALGPTSPWPRRLQLAMRASFVVWLILGAVYVVSGLKPFAVVGGLFGTLGIALWVTRAVLAFSHQRAGDTAPVRRGD